MRKIITGLAVAGLVFAGAVGTATTASAAQPGQRCSYESTSEPTLSSGSSGAAVRALQCELNTSILSTDGYGLTVDGQFGPATLAAVKHFQKCVHIEQDGVVGPNTWWWVDTISNSTGWVSC